jgi:hypothetical protein
MNSNRREETEEDLLRELLTRRDADQAARSAARGNEPEQVDRLIRVDDDNTAWLEQVVDLVGWPGRSRVGAEGAHAAWLLAQHADRHPALQERWLTLLEIAVAAGEASAADFACLTDRVLLARGEPQVYGTQLSARDGHFVACRLGEPDSVDQRRALVGLGALEAHLQDMLERYGPPKPAVLECPHCRGEIEVWPPEVGGQSTIRCPSCDWVTTIRARIKSTPR